MFLRLQGVSATMAETCQAPSEAITLDGFEDVRIFATGSETPVADEMPYISLMTLPLSGVCMRMSKAQAQRHVGVTSATVSPPDTAPSLKRRAS